MLEPVCGCDVVLKVFRLLASKAQNRQFTFLRDPAGEAIRASRCLHALRTPQAELSPRDVGRPILNVR